MTGQAAASDAGARISRVEKAYSELKARIETNRYPPGHTALENELAEELGMSRTPVREALIRLQQEGLVDVRPRRGMQVLGLSPQDMREIYEVIAGAEAVAVHLLAQQGSSAELETALGEPVARMERTLEAGDLEAWAAADENFHRALFRLCGNSRLESVGISHLDRTRRARFFTLHLRRRPFRSTADHRRLVELILAGDAKAAREATLSHRIDAMSELLEIIERYQIRAF
jgi:DNA-binding GntR family transcriptional regulator